MRWGWKRLALVLFCICIIIWRKRKHVAAFQINKWINQLRNMGFVPLFFFHLSLFFCLSFCLSALCDDRDVSAWTWHSWGHPSALHIKALSACASMLIRRKWPSTSHMSLHSSDTVCKSFFPLHSACSFFVHPPRSLLCSVNNAASHRSKQTWYGPERAGLSPMDGSNRILWEKRTHGFTVDWMTGIFSASVRWRERDVCEWAIWDKERIARCDCMHDWGGGCLWKRELVLFYSLSEVTISRKRHKAITRRAQQVLFDW